MAASIAVQVTFGSDGWFVLAVWVVTAVAVIGSIVASPPFRAYANRAGVPGLAIPKLPLVTDEQIWGSWQRDYVQALFREREGYARKGNRKGVREVDQQIVLARDNWWDRAKELSTVIEDGENSRSQYFVGSDFAAAWTEASIASVITLWTFKAKRVVTGGFPELANLFHEPLLHPIDPKSLRGYFDDRIGELLEIQRRTASP